MLEKAYYTYKNTVIRQAGQPTHLLVICSIPGSLQNNYKEKISSGKHFHNVLCLSEAKGMDIKMNVEQVQFSHSQRKRLDVP